MGRHETLAIYDYGIWNAGRHNYDRNKICDLYDSQNDLIGQAYDIAVTKEWNGTHTLTFKIPYIIDMAEEGTSIDAAIFGIAEYGISKFGEAIRRMGNLNFRWMFMKSDFMIRYTCGSEVIWFVANKPTKSKTNKNIYGDVTCAGFESLLKTRNIYMSFDDENGIGTIRYLMPEIVKGTGWTFNSAMSDILYERDGTTEKIRSLKSDGKKGALDLIITTCNLFKARPVFDTDAMIVTIKAINNRQQVLEGEVGRNLTALSVKNDSTDICTRLYVEGEYGDYGYVGIDDVKVDANGEIDPNGTKWGLPFLVNFDYYREIGVFKSTHETALATYLTDIRDIKQQIKDNATLMIAADDAINTMIGQCKMALYYNADLTTPAYTYGDITAEQATLNVGDEVYILLNNQKFTKTEWSGSSQLSSAYGVAKFATPSAGKIGSAEVQIEAKQKAIEQLQRKINVTVKPDKIAEYEAEIARLEAEISDIYNGTTDYEGLYPMMYNVMNSNGLLYQYNTYYNTNITLNEDQDDIEATFIAAMGYMLRDGYWNNNNYTAGQEEYLYSDALDMSREMGKPKTSYTFSYVRIAEDFDVQAEDIEINAIFKLYDKEIGVDDKLFVKKISYGVDNKSSGSIEVSNEDITLTGNDLGSLLSRMSQLADLIEQKNALYERARALNADGSIFADRLNGQIDVLRTQFLSTVSNWYTDEQGNIIFDNADGSSSMMLCGAGFMIANSKNDDGTWNYRTFGNGNGFTADEIIAGFISADRIETGTLAVSKLVPNAGTDLDISGNGAIAPPTFNTTTQYEIGDVVLYNGDYYRFTSRHKGAWNASHVAATTLGTEINLVPGKITTQINDSLGNYYTKTETASQISTAITSNNANYYTKTETASQITTAITSNNTNYYTKTETASKISTAITTNNGNYYTKTETASKISTAITSNNANYYTKTETASQISTYVGNNAYGKVAGIDINANGISLYATSSTSTNYINISTNGISSNSRHMNFSTSSGYTIYIQRWYFGRQDVASGILNSIVSTDASANHLAEINSYSSDGGLYLRAKGSICLRATNSSEGIWFNLNSGYDRIYGSNLMIGRSDGAGSYYVKFIYADKIYYNQLIQNSSREIKHDIVNLNNYGTKLDQLRPVSFVYDNDPDENTRMGLIYEETIEVMPEICTGEEGNKAINYVELIPVLLKEIQGLRSRVKALEEM